MQEGSQRSVAYVQADWPAVPRSQNHGRHNENVVRLQAATTPEQSQCTCAAQTAQTVSSVEAVSRRNTLRGRPSAGVFPRVFVSLTVLRHITQPDRVCRLAFFFT